MHFIDRKALPLALFTLLAGCSMVPPAPAPAPTPAPAPPPARPPISAVPAPSFGPAVARSWDEYRHQAARKMVAANPNGTYMGKPPEPLLAIPVLEVELHADGSVREIRVMRPPGQARDTIQLAIDAVRRGAPYGNVTNLPRPWKFVEVFLFDDNRRFKPRTLDQ